MAKIDTEKKRAFIISVVYLLIILALAYIVLKYAMPLLGPFVIAFIISYMLRGPIQWMQKKRALPYRICAALTVAVFFVSVGLLLFIAGVELIGALEKLVNLLPGFYTTQIEPFINQLFNRIEKLALQADPTLYRFLLDLETQAVNAVGDMVKNVSVSIVGAASNFATSIPGLFIKLVLLVISTFFISMDYERLRDFCVRQMNEKTQDIFFQVKEYLVGTLFVVIRSYALIMSITFVELSIGLTLIGIRYSVLIAACISIFDILPVLGTGGIMIPWGVANLVIGDYKLGLLLLLVYVIITVIRNILEPKIVGGQLGLHPVVTLASMFAGVHLLGVVGLFGFPIFLSLLVHLNEAGTFKIFK